MTRATRKVENNLFIPLLAAVFCSLAGAQNGDYSNVQDILSGRRTLLQVDDLVIGNLILSSSNSNLGHPTYPLTKMQIGKDNALASAQLFDRPHQTLVFAQTDTVSAIDPVTQEIHSVQVTDSPSAKTEFNYSKAAVGDFSADGFPDVVIASTNGIRVVTANDPRNPAAGIRLGPSGPLFYGDTYDLAITVGDFDGDGLPEVAVADLATLSIYKVDPKTLALTSVGFVYPSIKDQIPTIALAAGKFGATNHDQLLVAASSDGSTAFLSYDFNSSLQPQQQDLESLPGSFSELIIKSGYFDPSSPYQQVIVKINNSNGANIGFVSFDSSLKEYLQNPTSQGGAGCNAGLALGNFDHREPVLNNPARTQPSRYLQFALPNTCLYGDLTFTIFDVKPESPGSRTFVVSVGGVGAPQDADPQYLGLPTVATDVQGRSLLLGEPTKVVLNAATEPTAIIAAPPMHIDFSPSPGQATGPSTVINLSAAPKAFFTEYDTDQKSTNQSKQQNTNSWSFGAKETIGASVGYGIPGLASASISDAFSAAQDLKGKTEQEHGVSSSNSFDISAKTSFSDQVWFTQSRFNVYIYPVIGQSVCPPEQANCPDAAKVPLTVQFSAPDQTSFNVMSGNALEWYQPIWEPGNVLSYPASYSQLQTIVPNIQKLSADLTWATDGNSITERSTWANNSSSSQSTSSSQNYSFDNNTSVTASVNIEGFNASASASFDLSGSTGLSSLNQSSNTFGNSTGIAVTKPGFGNYLNYQYPVVPYIFGQAKPTNVTDNVPLSGDIQTFGMLQTAFVADPQASTAGGWWSQTYTTAPDVALNHPARWALSSSNAGGTPGPNCLSVGNPVVVQCATLAPSFPKDPWLSEYHWMRGLFISKANSGGQGPQLETATAGDKLLLQARVYNFSLSAMPDGTNVHARFYAQPWNATNNTPVGNSVLIGEDASIGQIPPFNDGEGAPVNWVLAKTTFDTTPYAGQHLAFWVVVWMEDGSGKLGPEIAGHGLSSIPGTLDSLADVPLEYTGSVSYSNNLGFYKSAFYIFGPTETPGSLRSDQGGAPETNITKVQLSARSTTRGVPIYISAQLSVGGKGQSGSTALFYDGDPRAGGQPFDMERASYIPANSRYEVKVPYRSDTCGPHELFIVINRGTPAELIRRAPPMSVECGGGLIRGIAPVGSPSLPREQ